MDSSSQHGPQSQRRALQRSKQDRLSLIAAGSTAISSELRSGPVRHRLLWVFPPFQYVMAGYHHIFRIEEQFFFLLPIVNFYFYFVVPRVVSMVIFPFPSGQCAETSSPTFPCCAECGTGSLIRGRRASSHRVESGRVRAKNQEPNK